HLDVADIAAGDVVIGTLPVHLAAEVCGRGAKFYFLSLVLSQSQRGQELTMGDMLSAQCRLQCFNVNLCDR
ncbi:MAG: CRISPR-associated protein Csx16, partial [Sulfuriferula sp.]